MDYLDWVRINNRAISKEERVFMRIRKELMLSRKKEQRKENPSIENYEHSKMVVNAIEQKIMQIFNKRGGISQ